MNDMNLKEVFTKGLVKENAIFAMGLGLCPTLAVSTMAVNGIGMGALVIFVLVCSNFINSLIRNFVPDQARIPCYIVVIATFVTIVDLIMQAYFPSLSESLGVFVKLVVVNCIVLGRVEAFASKNKPWPSVIDALGIGVGFAGALILISALREIFGAGSITLFPIGNFNGIIKIPLLESKAARMVGLPAGALLVVGYLRALVTSLAAKKTARGG